VRGEHLPEVPGQLGPRRAERGRLPGPWTVGRLGTARTPVGIDVLDLALVVPR
jgi:hypothetical protein